MPTLEAPSTQATPHHTGRAMPDWRQQLSACFAEIERRKTIAAQTQPIPADDFRRFVQETAAPAFREFHKALAQYGDKPEYQEGEDWVGLRWQEGHWIDINSLMRAPNRAAATIDRARAYRERYKEEGIRDFADFSQADILRWLVLSYAAFRRVSESELEFPAEDHLPSGTSAEPS